LKLNGTQWAMRHMRRPVVCAISGFAAVSGLLATNVQADPAGDALSKLNELSRQSEQMTEAMHSAQLDLDDKLAAQDAADKAHAGDEAALQAAKSRLTKFQSAVDRLAVATYMGGRTDGMDAILTAESPQQLIDKLTVQRVVGADMSTQMARYRAAGEQATQAEQTSAKSAAEAKTAAEQAAAVRADLQSKQSQLQVQIAVVKSQYSALTPGQRQAMAAPGPVPAAAPPPEAGPAPDGAPPPPDAAPEGVPGQGPPPMAPGGGGAPAAVQAALTQVGTPYSWGGSGPGGFDCSGLVMWSFQQAGIALPHSSQAQANGGETVSLSELQPGDVLTFYSDASHSGIYVGDGMMIHSSTYGQPVQVVPMEASGPVHNARRY
jgi:cell wall-associated NlpC family hydrolase